ncbi:MAG: helix-turn-helix domain-containing protein [Thermoprotei archaeon]
MYFNERLMVCVDCKKADMKRTPTRVVSGGGRVPRPKQVSRPRQEPQELPDLREEFGALIKEKRENMGLTIQELAAKVGIKESIMRRIEADRFTPDIETARRIGRFLHLELVTEHAEDKPVTISTQSESELELRHVARLRQRAEESSE